MRNLKSDLPIRPIYLHRDDAIVALCFVCVMALTVYTLIERDCQANPVLVEAGLRTTDQVLSVLGAFCVSVHLTPSGYEVFWPDTPTEKQKLIWRQLQIPDPGTRVPDVRSASQEADSTRNSASFLEFGALQRIHRAARGLSNRGFGPPNGSLLGRPVPRIWIGKVLIPSYLFRYAENQMNYMEYRQVNRAVIVALLASLVIVAVAAGCGRGATPEVIEKKVVVEKEKVVTATPEPVDTSKYGGTLVRQTGGLVQFDPIFIADDPSFHVASNVFSLLFRRQGPELVPDLATSWEYEDDRTIIFHLRKGVMWHDDNAVFPKGESRKVVADDVVYSIKRAVETEGSTIAADFLASYESVEALDDYTVKLTLKTPNALLFTLGRGLSGMAIVPREAVEQLGEDFALNPIGSGPFKFVEYKPDESLTLERNDLYWKKPYLDKVIYKVIPDQDAALIAFEAGEVDILGSVPNAEFERLNADNGFILYPGGCPVMVQLVFNMTNPLHAEQKFRQAVAYALDGDAIDANVYGGMHVSGCGTAGPGVPGYDPNLCKHFPYDPEGARAILKELGWEDTNGDGVLDKDGKRMEFPLQIWSMSPMPQFGAAIATQLKEIGIPVELQTVEFGTWIADWNAGVDKAMMMGGWCGDGGMNGLWGAEGMARSMGYDDPEVFELLDKANTIVDPAERDKTLREAANKIYSQYWAVPMGFHNLYSASRSWVHDFHGTLWFENFTTDYNNVWMTK